MSLLSLERARDVFHPTVLVGTSVVTEKIAKVETTYSLHCS